MNQTLSRLLASRFGLYFLVMAVFGVVTALLGHVQAGLVELAVTVFLFVVYLRSSLRQQKAVLRYVEELLGSMDGATRDSALNCPLPVVMFRPDTGEVVWTNERFLLLTGDRERMFDTRLSDLAPDFDERWLLEGKEICPTEVTLEQRRYQVFGHIVRGTVGDQERGLATTYWVDITDLANTRDTYRASRPAAAILLLDNYEDTIKGQEENVGSAMLSQINRKLSQWVAPAGGIYCKLDRDRFLFLFEGQHLDRYKAEKFSVLDDIRSVQTPGGIPVTLSIGIGVDGDSLEELYRFAALSVEMALSRGGDQAVVRNRFNFEFYGGRAKETERRTKVKSRVMASALGELVADASCVLVMGHRVMDMDSVGAGVGVCAIARKKGVPHYIVREDGPSPADELLRHVEEMEHYRGLFLDSQEALLRADSDSLLVVVDTNRPEQVCSQELLTSCNKVAVIDHHRRAATYIEGAALNFHEPYASSASELVTELIGYLIEPSELYRGEAEALMAGIMLDTKRFTMRTGGRTFEAAAFLRRAGGDTAEVKKLFQNDLASTIAKYGIIQNARIYRQDIAIASVDHPVGVAAPQAADELLNIAGVNTSFVLCPEGDRVALSARSMNETNVQVIVEALGGGGNGNAAGAQIPNRTVEQATQDLIAALDQYFAGQDDENGGVG